jgi:carboxypeptidase D
MVSLIRFTGIDVLQAAGPAARIPSKLSGQQDSILGVTHPNGTTLEPPPGAEVVPLDPEEAEAQQEAKDNSREAFYGPRRSVVLTLLLFAVLALLVLLVRWVSQKRRWRARGVQLGSTVAREPRKRRTSHKLKGKGKARSVWFEEEKAVELEDLIRGEEDV